MKSARYWLFFLGCAALPSVAAPLRPVVLAQRGDVNVTPAKGAARTTQAGEVLARGERVDVRGETRAAIALAPGQMATLRNGGGLKMEALHDGRTGARVRLESGTVDCWIKPGRPADQPVFVLLAGKDSFQARGTLWTTTILDNGNVVTAVLHSTLALTLGESGAQIFVTAGHVITSEYNAEGQWLQTTLVDLTTGQKTLYLAAAPTSPLTSPASTTEIGQAAAFFQNGLDSASGWTTESLRDATLLVTQINAVLNSAGLPPLVAPTPRDDALTPGSDVRDTLLASPEAPPSN